VADDAAGEQPGDLDDADARAGGGLEQHGVALVVLAGLVEVGGQEGAGPVGDVEHGAGAGQALPVHVEHGREHGDPGGGFAPAAGRGPGREAPSRPRPPAGTRCTWTSRTDRNTLTRGAGSRGRSSSGGGSTSETPATVPSAAESATPVSGGRTRRGLRKNSAVAAVAARPAAVPRPVASRTAVAAPATAATSGRPPGCMGGIASRTSRATWGSDKPGPGRPRCAPVGSRGAAASTGGVGSCMEADRLLR